MTKLNIFLNGKEQQFNEGTNIEEVVKTLNMKNPMFVVELNLNIVQKEDYQTTFIKDGDKIEVVTFFGGG